MDCKYLINMKDGRLVFRNAETDTHVNLRPVPDSIVKMIMKGEVTEHEVICAISAKVKEAGDFDLEKYISDLRKLNVRVSNPQEAPVHEPLKDRSDEEISVDDIVKVRGKPHPTKKEMKAKADALQEKKNAKMDEALGKAFEGLV